MSIREKQQDILDELEAFETWPEKFEYIIDCAKELPDYPEDFRTEDFQVKGCQSKVWLHPRKEGNKLYFDADSDSLFVKGMVAILVRAYEDATPEEILETPADFVKESGLIRNLTPNRANGVGAMLKQLMTYAEATREK
jgi:cysteine desulfuration protein SufE